MKKILVGLLCSAFLTSCAPAVQSAPVQPQVGTEQVVGLSLELEHKVYDPSLTSYTYFIRNDTAETVEFGEDYRIQQKNGESWQDLKVRENVAWTAIAYDLRPGQTKAMNCGFWLYEEPPEAGTYRLVKEVGGAELTAEFILGESPYTAETPYGFAPLEELPEDAYLTSGEDDGTMVFTEGAEADTASAEMFLELVSLDAPCQLRTAQDYGQGWPIVIDVIYENESFLWRMLSGGEITEQRFSYLVTDGTDLYLSNGADWASTEGYGSDTAFLLPPGEGAELSAAVEQMTKRRLAGNTARYRVWSADGVWDAALTEEPTEFSVGWQRPGEGSGGGVYDLQDWDGSGIEILDLEWLEDNTLRLTCETVDEQISRLVYDPGHQTLESA